MTVQLTPLLPERFDAWRARTKARLVSLRQDSGMLIGADAVAQADAFLGELLADGLDTASSRILQITDGAQELGAIWLAVTHKKLFIIDLAFTEDPRADQRDELFSLLQEIARSEEVTRVSVSFFCHDVAGLKVIDGKHFTLASIQMILEPLPNPPRDGSPSVEVLPMTAERYPSFAVTSEAEFARDLAESGRYSPKEAAAESHRQMMLELPDGVDTEGQKLFTATVDGVEVGILWIGMRSRGGRPHAFILDIEVASDQRRRGYGRELMLSAEREARRLGANSIGLHVFGFNKGAIALYEQLGYRRLEESYFLDV